MALAADRNTPRMHGDMRRLPVKGSTKVFAGALVALNTSGYALGGVTGLNLIGAGCAQEQIDNSAGADGDLFVNIRTGMFRYANSASTDAITAADVGHVCFIVDDATVAKTDGTGTRSRAGMIAGVDDIGVWVLLDPANVNALGKIYVPLRVTTLVGTGVYYAVAPVPGRITAIRSIIEGVLTTGDATLTGKINGTGITGGVITITQSASAAGDVDSATPSALNVVAAGDKLSLTVGGTNATATVANCLMEITL